MTNEPRRKVTPEYQANAAWTLISRGECGIFLKCVGNGSIVMRRFGEPRHCEYLAEIAGKLDMDQVKEHVEVVLDQ